MQYRLDNFQRFFFIGIAGAGMSALAQYLRGLGKEVSGSDRYFSQGLGLEVREKLEAEGIHCFPQGAGLPQTGIDLVIASTAVEDQVPEMKSARESSIPVIRRSELLAMICDSRQTIAVGGTSGKSTTSALLFDMLEAGGLKPGIISGAGLLSLMDAGRLGNATVGEGEWMVIEADESDGSIVQYHPAIGLLLNIDKDHQEMHTLMELFRQFRDHSQYFVVNASQDPARQLSADARNDFASTPGTDAGTVATDFRQEGLQSFFRINGFPFEVALPGKHNMENVLAAAAVAMHLGVSAADCARAAAAYRGIYRRHQLIGEKNGIRLIDDYAHNPAKCAASIRACQPLTPKLLAWFQPHGYGPTRFLKNDFIEQLADALRPEDEIWLSEIYYAGGTATRDISAEEIVTGIREKGKKAFFVPDRNNLADQVRSHLVPGGVLLLMGARDPSLEQFARQVLDCL